MSLIYSIYSTIKKHFGSPSSKGEPHIDKQVSSAVPFERCATKDYKISFRCGSSVRTLSVRDMIKHIKNNGKIPGDTTGKALMKLCTYLGVGPVRYKYSSASDIILFLKRTEPWDDLFDSDSESGSKSESESEWTVSYESDSEIW
jgi:hypothetical protein